MSYERLKHDGPEVNKKKGKSKKRRTSSGSGNSLLSNDVPQEEEMPIDILGRSRRISIGASRPNAPQPQAEHISDRFRSAQPSPRRSSASGMLRGSKSTTSVNNQENMGNQSKNKEKAIKKSKLDNLGQQVEYMEERQEFIENYLEAIHSDIKTISSNQRSLGARMSFFSETLCGMSQGQKYYIRKFGEDPMPLEEEDSTCGCASCLIM